MYKGYYYDVETGLYYLINRYYDPAVGRFISPDDANYIDFESFFGTNRYAYCVNNPVMNIDPTGHSALVTGIILGLTFVLTFATSIVSAGKEKNWQLDWKDYARASIEGLFSVIFTCLGMVGMNLAVSIWVNVMHSYLKCLTTMIVLGEDWSNEKVLNSLIDGVKAGYNMGKKTKKESTMKHYAEQYGKSDLTIIYEAVEEKLKEFIEELMNI